MAGRTRASALAHLTDNEGSVLSLVTRREPVSTYQLLRIFEQSPVTGLNDTKGVIYPVVARLKDRGLLSGRVLAADRRRTEMLRCTAKGRKALQHWLMTIPPATILPQDSLRTRLLSFDLLTREERLNWARDALQMVVAKKEEIEAFEIGLSFPFQAHIFSHLELTLEARRVWLQQMMDSFAADDREADEFTG